MRIIGAPYSVAIFSAYRNDSGKSTQQTAMRLLFCRSNGDRSISSLSSDASVSEWSRKQSEEFVQAFSIGQCKARRNRAMKLPKANSTASSHIETFRPKGITTTERG
jgi:hypothetical protein